MSKDTIPSYSATAASNTDVGGVGIAGTNAISNADDALREIMSHLKEMSAGTNPVEDTMTFADPADLTKRVRLDAGGVTAGQTRVLASPDYNGTIATLAGTETLTNKTLASPAFTTGATVTATNDGATGATLTTTHVSASPAANDAVAIWYANGRDSAGNSQEYGEIVALIVDPTSTSEDGAWDFYTTIAGTGAQRLRIGAGLAMAGATGGDPGAGKINATEVQVNGVSLGTAAPDYGAGNAALSYGGVGTYVLGYIDNTGITDSTTYAGSIIEPAGIAGSSAFTVTDDGENTSNAITKGGSALSGTWRAMGRANNDSGSTRDRVTLFLRTV